MMAAAAPSPARTTRAKRGLSMTDPVIDLLNGNDDGDDDIIEIFTLPPQNKNRDDNDLRSPDGRATKHRRLDDHDFSHKNCVMGQKCSNPQGSVVVTTAKTTEVSPSSEEQTAEDADYSLALRLQMEEEEEERQQTLQEQQERQSLQLAWKLQEEEDMRSMVAMAVPAHTKSVTKEQVLASLEPCQQKALAFVESKAKAAHEEALGKLKQRVKLLIAKESKVRSELGPDAAPPISSDDVLQRCLDYIREEAPIAIHVKPTVFPKLLQDTHYRNLFETNSSGGCTNKGSRSSWERTMFGDAYDSCAPVDRPKYGVLNVTGDIQGVKVAQSYGTLIMTLANHVRHRTTFFGKDTGGFLPASSLATNEYYGHILQSFYNDAELRAVLGVCRIGGAPSSTLATYKEVQIHGPVCLETDIQALSVPGKEADATAELRKQVDQFQKMTGCNVMWQGDLTGEEEEEEEDGSDEE